MLYIHRSNHVEALAAQLADVLRQSPLREPMTPEQIAVPGRGIERWLSHALARHLRATANIEWPFPALAIERAIAGLAGDTVTAGRRLNGAWQAQTLAWAVLAALPARLQDPEFTPLRTWIGAVAGEAIDPTFATIDRRRFQLAQRIADVFDRYANWRPDLVLAWDRYETNVLELSDADAWQPILWRDVRFRMRQRGLGLAGEPLYVRLEQLEQDLRNGLAPRPDDAPERLILFSISTLPELHMRAVRALSLRMDVHLFVLTPSQELWTHVRAKADIARRLRRAGREATAQDLLLEEGNPLLASLGRLGRDFQWLLEATEPGETQVEEPEPRFIEPGEATLLAILQSDVLHLRHRGRRVATATGDEPEMPFAPLPLRENDDSLRIHACHGPTRQVEVLRDELLALFAADPTLQPRHVVVMTPDVETFAPLVEAVFQAGQPDGDLTWSDVGFPRIPVAIADRTLRHENPVAEVLLRVLDLERARATASEVLDLLALDPVRRKFGLQPEDLQQIQAWIGEAGIRWGLDAEHRAQHGQPRDPQNTWRFGLDRLLLGIAMADEHGHLFAGVLPFDEMEGGQVALLGKLTAFCEALFDLGHRLTAPRTLAQWQVALTEVVTRLTETAENQSWLTRQVLDALAALPDETGELPAPLTVDAMHALLEGRFSVATATKGLMTGAVTFCALVPLRSMPFRVVCLLGLDEDVFPRRTAASGFDLASAHPRIGDRTPRDDDRYLFLEAILAARDKLRVFFTGRDAQRNQGRPPAVPVAELLDVAEASVFVSQGTVREQLVHEHPLQPFSPRNFGLDTANPLSFDKRMQVAAGRLLGARLTEMPPLFQAPLPAATETMPTLAVSLRDLKAFFELPVSFLLHRRLGLYLRTSEGAVDDREPVELNKLQDWQVGDGILRRRLAGQPEAMVQAALRASGLLPPGALGHVAFTDLEVTAADILQRTQAWQLGTSRSVAVDAQLTVPDQGEVRLVGTVDPVWAGGLVAHRFGKIRAKHEISTWIDHLALELVEPELAHTSVFLGTPQGKDGGEVTFGPLGPDATTREAHARQHLTELVRLFLAGQRVPLAWFPNTSFAYATKWFDPKLTDDESRARAAGKAANDEWKRGKDTEDAHTALVFADLEPFRPHVALPAGAESMGLDFHTLAMTICTPMRQVRNLGAADPQASNEGAVS